MITIVGLSLGAGYLMLGGSVVVVALLVLGDLTYLEARMMRAHSALLTLETDTDRPTDEEVSLRVTEAGYRITLVLATAVRQAMSIQMKYNIM